ncbi:MAG: type II secretion system protein GspF, partial [Sphingobium sp.]
MAAFDYVAIDTGGRECKGSVRAETMDDARARLAARSLFVVRLEQGTADGARRRAVCASLRSPRLSANE